MKINEQLELLNKYSQCPNCGDSKVGNGSGKLIMDEKYFYRECKCGWKVEVKEKE